jgi:hypothetical protein
MLYDGDGERGGFSSAGLSGSEEVISIQKHRNALLLNGGGSGVTLVF